VVKKAPAKKTSARKVAAENTAGKALARKVAARNVPQTSVTQLQGAGTRPRQRINDAEAKRRIKQARQRIPTAEEIRRGIQTDALTQLGARLEISDEQLFAVVKLSRATWGRRRESGQLTHEESDRAANVMRAYARAVDYFEGHEDAARRWMKHPAPALDGETPLKRCDTATGAQEVIDLLSRLEYGIPA
jgi:putative toxin-antitoxin system antitoxin component (TIGR02293 family)